MSAPIGPQPHHSPLKGAMRSTLARRYALQVGTISLVLLSVAGLVEGAFSYRQARAQIAQLQAVRAQAAAREIEQYLHAVAKAVDQVQVLPWGTPDFGPVQRRDELQRLLKLSPSIVSIGDHDAQGRERLFVSHAVLDRVGSAQTLPPPVPSVSPVRPGFGNAFFDEQGVPNVVLSAPLHIGKGEGNGESEGDGRASLSRVVINLRFLADVVSGLRVPDEGQIYVVDESATLLAHPDPTLALGQLSLAKHPPVVAAQRALAVSQPLPEAIDAVGIRGGDSITTAVPMREPRWLVFVEQPRARALAPAIATFERTLVLLAVGGGAALSASLLAARRMAAPIARLREATAGLAAGQLGTQLQVHSGDEIELLANDFNAMSSRLEQSYKVLEDKVDERTASLKLRTAEAQYANAEKSRFVVVVSHDLREPLHAIGLMTGALRSRLVDADTQHLADELQKTVQAMDKLFHALLQISNLEAGGVTPRPAVFALQDVLQTARHAYTPLATAKGLVLRVRPTDQSCYADPTILSQIVGNLCTNAIRYTTHGGVLLACRRRAGAVVLQVYDTGIGIAEQHLATVFDPFVRLRQTPTDGGQAGLGLGLAIVKRNAELLGLRIGVVSRPGCGSRFEIALPALPSGATPGALADAFVLLVDGDAHSREATALALRQAGSLVATAGSADAALAEIRQHQRSPDAIVIDLEPVGTPAERADAEGQDFALVQKLRQELGEPVPVLMLIAATRLPAPAMPGVQVLHKPAGHAQLLEALAGCLPPVKPDAA